jgi:hypothetical protein
MFTDIICDMSSRSTHAVLSLRRRFQHECEQFTRNQMEMEKIEDAYFRYRGLLHEQEETRRNIVRIFGTLGVQSPDVSRKFAEAVALPDSRTIRQDDLKLWEMIELFLAALDDTATINEIKRFLTDMKMSGITAQAINSAIKTHPETFEEISGESEKRIRLKEHLPGKKA